MKYKQSLFVVIIGILLLAIAMGISRFSFTPMLPFMKEETGASSAALGYLASSNYIGYLIGAIGAGHVRFQKQKALWYCVIWNIVSLLMMALTNSFIFWLTMRLLAGITSGFIFVLTSSLVLDFLANKRSDWAGYVYGGVGIGIVLSGILVPIFNSMFSWKEAWIGLCLLALLLALVVLLLWRKIEWPTYKEIAASHPHETETNHFLPWLIVAYGLEGFGYIITATFLVDMVYETPLKEFAAYSWIIVGLAAIPSTHLWMIAMNKWKPVQVLCAAFLLQAIGVTLPVYSQQLISIVIAAFLFGVTFMGITVICTAYARRLAPVNSQRIIGKLTAFYAFGQIIGPIIAGNLAAKSGHYTIALLLAGSSLLLAILLLLTGQKKNRLRKEEQSCHM